MGSALIIISMDIDVRGNFDRMNLHYVTGNISLSVGASVKAVRLYVLFCRSSPHLV